MTVATPPAAPATLLTAPAEGTPATGDAASPPSGTPPVVPPAEGAPATPPVAPPEGTPPADASAKVEIKLPEGYSLDDATRGELDALVAEAKLSGEQTQRLVDLHVKTQQAMFAQAEQAMARQAAEWTAIIKADPEIGGAAHAQALAHAKSVLAQYGTPALIQELNATGMGNNPEVVRLLARLGKATAEDTVAGKQGGTKATPANNDEAALREMYPTMFAAP